MDVTIVRRQLTPPGDDRVLCEMLNATEQEVRDNVVALAKAYSQIHDGCTSIAYDRDDPQIRATLIGYVPKGDRGCDLRYSINSSLIQIKAVEL